MKIGPVDTEIALLRVKKVEITEGKIYSLFGKFAERAKLENAWQSLVYSPLGAVVSPISEYF